MRKVIFINGSHFCQSMTMNIRNKTWHVFVVLLNETSAVFLWHRLFLFLIECDLSLESKNLLNVAVTFIKSFYCLI